MYYQKLYSAVKSGDLKTVIALVEEDKIDVNFRNYYGSTALYYASAKGQIKVVRYLVEKAKADINTKNNLGLTPLHYACEKGQIKVVRYLVEKAKADINAKSNTGLTPLHYACEEGAIEVVIYLVEEAKTTAYDQILNDSTSLYYASIGGNHAVVRYLIEEVGIYINALDKSGETVLEKLENRDILNYSGRLKSYNLLKSADIGQKLFAQSELTKEEQVFIASDDYTPTYFNNLKSKSIAEKKFLMVETSVEEDDFLNSESYNPKFSERHQQISKSVKALGEHLKVAKTEGEYKWNSEERILEGEVLQIEPQSLKGFDIPKDATNVIASFLKTGDTEKFSLVSYSIAKDLEKIEQRLPPLEIGLLPQDIIDIGTIDLNTELLSPWAWFTIGYTAGSFAINPGLRCVDNYMDEQALNRSCSEYYKDVLSIDNLFSTAASYVGNYIASALSLRSIHGINIQDMYIYHHYPTMLGLAVASVPVLLEIVL